MCKSTLAPFLHRLLGQVTAAAMMNWPQAMLNASVLLKIASAHVPTSTAIGEGCNISAHILQPNMDIDTGCPIMCFTHLSTRYSVPLRPIDTEDSTLFHRSMKNEAAKR